MNSPLSNLKRAMNKTVFKELSFSDERKNAVKESISSKYTNYQLHSWQEKIIIAVLESLELGPKHGFDISTQLFQKQEFHFQRNEGHLYTLLHLLENKKFITSTWVREEKYYSITRKGMKCLAASEQGKTTENVALKQFLEEASYGNF